MSQLWVLAALIAALAQTARNAAQAGLTRVIGTVGATQVRFLFGLPFAIVFLALALLVTGEALPVPTLRSLGFTTLGALAQIAATALMLVVMKSHGFAVTTAWLKTEPVMVALVAAAVLGDPLSVPMLAAIVIATAGVLIMSVRPGTGGALWRQGGPALAGIMAGALFGLSAIGFRGGITALESGSFLMRATTVLVQSLGLQAGLLTVWLALFDRKALRGSVAVWRSSLLAGFLGAFASQFWFIGFSLTSAANVRTVALVEVVFAQIVARRLFGQAGSWRQLLGMAVIMLGVGLLLRLQV